MNSDERQDVIGRDGREQICGVIGRLCPSLWHLRLLSLLHGERLAAVNILHF